MLARTRGARTPDQGSVITDRFNQFEAGVASQQPARLPHAVWLAWGRGDDLLRQFVEAPQIVLDRQLIHS